MKDRLRSAACLAMFLLAACSGTEESEPAALSDLQINSAKRQCVSVAVLQQVPNEAAREICDCPVDALIDAGQMTAGSMPTDAQQQGALDACIARYEPGQRRGPTRSPSGAAGGSEGLVEP